MQRLRRFCWLIRYGVRPERMQLGIRDSIAVCEADAILVIGDRAMDLDTHEFCESWDLGEQWLKETGLPFVFAMWVARDGAMPEVASALQKSRRRGPQEPG